MLAFFFNLTDKQTNKQTNKTDEQSLPSYKHPLEQAPPSSPTFEISAPGAYSRIYSVRPSWVDVTTAAIPILLKLGRETKWLCFGAIFEISSGQGKSWIYPNPKIFQRSILKNK